MIRFIAAIDEKRGIADDHGIPWLGRIPADAGYFRNKITTGSLLMGYGVYKELKQPFPDVTNYVATGGQAVDLREGFVPILDARKFLDNVSDDIWDLMERRFLPAQLIWPTNCI